MTRTVTRSTPFDPKPEMSAVGYLVAAGTLLLLIPLLPFLAVLWLLDRLRGGEEPAAT